ncbi:hypothetical protein [uncultured Corynebacterium sp.]|uniref:hypothetical protein n=1 Tax=uncultured Corynebacterium sp. TaxID=159447 RepID=UPI0025E26956|nr:hypothetical protein [uncultured Corynebacterium sp.]
MAAVETYFTTFCISTIFDRYVEQSPREFERSGWNEYKQFYRSLGSGIPNSRSIPSDPVALREAIVSDSSRVSFTYSSRLFFVASSFSGCEIDKEGFWAKVAEKSGRDVEYLMQGKLWDIIVERRNMMVHSGDFLLNSSDQRPISSTDLESVLTLAEAIVATMEEVCV